MVIISPDMDLVFVTGTIAAVVALIAMSLALLLDFIRNYRRKK